MKSTDHGAASATQKKNAAAVPRKTTNTTTARSSVTRSSADRNGPAEAAQELRLIAPQKLWRSATNRFVEKDEEYVKLRENIREHGILQPLVVRALPVGEWFLDPGTRNKVPGFFVTCRAYHAYLQQPRAQRHPVWSEFIPAFFATQPEAEAQLPEWEIVIGEHRWTAALELGLAAVPIIVRSMDDRTAVLTQLSENLRRKHLKPLDEARGYQRMMDLGMKVEDIGRELGSADKELSKSTIYARLKLLKLPATALEAVEKGIIPASHAELITKLATPEAQTALTAQMLTPKDVSAGGKYVKEMISFREAKQLAETAAQDEEKEQRWQETTGDFRAKGYQVLTIKQSAGVFQYGRMKAGYVGAGDKCDLDPQGRTWKALLGTHAPTPSVARDSYGGKAHVVYARKAAEKALKAAGHDLAAAPGKKSDPGLAQKLRREKLEREQAIRKAKAAEDIAKVVAAAEAREPNADFYRLLITGLVDCGIEEGVLERRKIEVLEKDGWQKEAVALKRYAAKADGKTLRGLLIECVLWDWKGADEKLLQAAADVFKVKLQTSGKKKGAVADGEDDEA